MDLKELKRTIFLTKLEKLEKIVAWEAFREIAIPRTKEEAIVWENNDRIINNLKLGINERTN